MKMLMYFRVKLPHQSMYDGGPAIQGNLRKNNLPSRVDRYGVGTLGVLKEE